MPVQPIAALDLCTVGQVRDWIGGTVQSGDHDALLQELIHAASQWAARYCKRDSFLSASYVHDGTTRERLAGSGTSRIFLRNTPITSISVLKPWPDSDGLVQGWDQDYDFDPWTGEVCLNYPSTVSVVFPRRPRVVEITYLGGYFPEGGAPAADLKEFGITEKASDLVESVVMQTGELFRLRSQRKEGLSGYSTEGGTFTFNPKALLPAVKDIWDFHRHPRVG